MLPKKPAEIFFSLKMFFLHFWRDAYSLENLKKKKKKKNKKYLKIKKKLIINW
jgi:hypothetical protein